MINALMCGNTEHFKTKIEMFTKSVHKKGSNVFGNISMDTEVFSGTVDNFFTPQEFVYLHLLFSKMRTWNHFCGRSYVNV